MRRRPLICGLKVGDNYFRVHPKGVGIICRREGGLPALTFIEEYLGEVHTPARWFEIQVAPPSYFHPLLGFARQIAIAVKLI
jgi:hypothetical protein